VRRATHRFALAGVAANALWVVLLLVGCTASTTTAGQTATSKASPIPAEAPVSLTRLLTAPVPSLCGLPAGTLANGILPGLSLGQGGVHLGATIVRDLETGAAPKTVAVSSYTGSPVIAAAVNCHNAEVKTNRIVELGLDQVVLWDKDFKVLGSFDVNAIAASIARSSIHSISVSDDGSFVVRWTALDTGEHLDPSNVLCCGTKSAELALRWDGYIILPGTPTYYNASQVVAKLVEAVTAGKPVSFDVAGAQAVERLKEVTDQGATFDTSSIRCSEVNFSYDPSYPNSVDPDLVGFEYGTDGRSCEIPATNKERVGGRTLVKATFYVNHLGWNYYRVTSGDIETDTLKDYPPRSRTP